MLEFLMSKLSRQVAVLAKEIFVGPFNRTHHRWILAPEHPEGMD